MGVSYNGICGLDSNSISVAYLLTQYYHNLQRHKETNAAAIKSRPIQCP